MEDNSNFLTKKGMIQMLMKFLLKTDKQEFLFKIVAARLRASQLISVYYEVILQP